MTTQVRHTDLSVESFLVLRTAFFDRAGRPRPYALRDKLNTQDDPFDERVHQLLTEGLPPGCEAIPAPGPLITPDMVVMRPESCYGRKRLTLIDDLPSIMALEVKKLERTTSGAVARSSGLDYNTTPPCGTVRIYDSATQPVDVRSLGSGSVWAI